MMPTSNQQLNPAAGNTLSAAVILEGTYPVFFEVPSAGAMQGQSQGSVHPHGGGMARH